MPSPALRPQPFLSILTPTSSPSPDLPVAGVEEKGSTQWSYQSTAIFGGVFLVLVLAIVAFTLRRRFRTTRDQPLRSTM